MFDENAESSRARTEAARERLAFKELFDSVMLDIQNEANAGNLKTRYRVSADAVRHVPSLVEALTEREYTVISDEEDRPMLTISWEE